ncbi:MAG: hypothetical protein FJ293_11920 [Planctomycetes bacterium]|nr:hypothetical protein [Planctomycetota bacterium]
MPPPPEPLEDADEVVGPPITPPPLPAEDDATRKAAGRTFPCQACGADLAFDPAAQAPKCPYCGHVAAVGGSARPVSENSLEAALDKAAERRAEVGKHDDLHEVRCSGCGANVQFVGALTAQRCPYCSQPIAREGVHDATQRLPVDGVVPFRIDGARAGAELQRWVASRWFLPGPLKRDGISAAFQGVYLPFFTFDALTANRYTGMRGEHYWVTVGSGKNRTRVRRTRWWPAAGSFRRFFDDQLECAGAGLPDARMRELEPWPLAQVQPWRPEYLAGFLARTYERPLPDCFKSAKKQIEAELDADVRRRIGGDEQRVLSLSTDWSALTYKHLLLPVFLASYRWREKDYRLVVNAATGEVQGERPWSVGRIAALIVLVLAAAAGVVFVLQRR